MPLELNRTMTARLVQSAAGPLESPTTPSMLATPGVASNCTSNAPLCEATALFCQMPALVTQLGSVTSTVDVPLLPSLVAVTVAVPLATPVRRPLAEMVATASLLVVHITGRPVSGRPAESKVAATSCVAAPACTLAVVGLTVTDATATIAAVVLLPKNAGSAMLFQGLMFFPWPPIRI